MYITNITNTLIALIVLIAFIVTIELTLSFVLSVTFGSN